jgi:signal peptidase I
MPAASDSSRNLCKHNLAVEVLRTTGTLRLTAFGYSMLPALWPGEVLTVKAKSLDQIQRGDVVLFAREGRFFIHRNLGPTKTHCELRLLTRGDAMPHPDEPVTADELLGKIEGVERGARQMAVPACTVVRRCVGLLLAYSCRARSLALRWRAWRSPTAQTIQPDVVSDQLWVR